MSGNMKRERIDTSITRFGYDEENDNLHYRYKYKSHSLDLKPPTAVMRPVAGP